MLALLCWCFFGLIYGTYRFVTAKGGEDYAYDQAPWFFFMAYVIVGPFGLLLPRQG